jgi:phage tail-like protein
MRSDPYLGCNFLIAIEGLVVGGFSECSGLEVETEVVPYREGGVNDYIHRFAGATSSPPLVLRHGITSGGELWLWCQMTAAGQIDRRNGTIFLHDTGGTAVIQWDFREAFPHKWTGPELRAETASVAFETIELAHRGLRRSRPRGA